MTRFKNLSSLLLHISTWLSTMNGYNITDSTVPDYAECLWHLNRVLWFAWLIDEPSGWSSPTQSLRVWGSNPLVTLRFFLCAIVVPNVQYLSRNSVHKYEYGTKPQLCPHARTRYLQKINKPINYHPETVKKLSSPADCSFNSSLAVDRFTMHVIEWSAILNTKWTIKLWSCRFSNTNHLSI